MGQLAPFIDIHSIYPHKNDISFAKTVGFVQNFIKYILWINAMWAHLGLLYTVHPYPHQNEISLAKTRGLV